MWIKRSTALTKNYHTKKHNEKSTAKKNKYVSVVQFTDEWVPNEDIDTSFAEWSKKNAKTFMSVIYNKTDNPAISESQDRRKSEHP